MGFMCYVSPPSASLRAARLAIADAIPVSASCEVQVPLEAPAELRREPTALGVRCLQAILQVDTKLTSPQRTALNDAPNQLSNVLKVISKRLGHAAVPSSLQLGSGHAFRSKCTEREMRLC